MATRTEREVISQEALERLVSRVAEGSREDADSDIRGDGWRIRAAGQRVAVEDYLLPAWLELHSGGLDDQPTMVCRVEVRDGVPACVDVRFTSSPGQREVRQSDLRRVQLGAIVEDLLAGFTFRFTRTGALRISTPDTSFYTDALHRVQRARSGRASRSITPALLERVADIYRRNVHDRPTQAVQRALAVSPRMASEYVQRARRAGMLPQTTRGKKQA